MMTTIVIISCRRIIQFVIIHPSKDVSPTSSTTPMTVRPAVTRFCSRARMRGGGEHVWYNFDTFEIMDFIHMIDCQRHLQADSMMLPHVYAINWTIQLRLIDLIIRFSTFMECISKPFNLIFHIYIFSHITSRKCIIIFILIYPFVYVYSNVLWNRLT